MILLFSLASIDTHNARMFLFNPDLGFILSGMLQIVYKDPCTKFLSFRLLRFLNF